MLQTQGVYVSGALEFVVTRAQRREQRVAERVCDGTCFAGAWRPLLCCWSCSLRTLQRHRELDHAMDPWHPFMQCAPDPVQRIRV